MSNKKAVSRDFTSLMVRVVVGAIFLWHGVPKAIDPAMAVDKFIGFGLPGILGPVTGVVEIAAATLLIGGLLHRWAALALAAVITGALVTVQIPAGISAGLERDLLILAGTLFLAVHGPGRFALGFPDPASHGRERVSSVDLKGEVVG